MHAAPCDRVQNPVRSRRTHGAHHFTPERSGADELEEKIGLSAKTLADVIEVPPDRLYQVLAGKRNVTADTALRLARYFGISAECVVSFVLIECS